MHMTIAVRPISVGCSQVMAPFCSQLSKLENVKMFYLYRQK